jgi:biopolymer transport protein ExbD
MINIGVSASGDLHLDTQPITLPELEKKLAARRTQDPNTPVYISGDSETRHADMVRALDAVRRAGFTKVAFNVRPGTPTAPALGR